MFRLQQCFKCIVRSSSKFRNVSTTSTKKSSFRNIPSLAFGKYLLHTNIVSSGVLMWLGDLCEQELEYRDGKLKERYDYGRMTRMLLVGLAMGPLHHYYYLYIARKLPKRELSTVAVKIGLDQFFMSPVCIAFFFYGIGVLEQKPVEKMNEEIKHKFMEVYVMDWCVWVPTQFINFYFVPVKYQVLYINGITMLYNVFLSFIKHKDLEMNDEQVKGVGKPYVLTQKTDNNTKRS